MSGWIRSALVSALSYDVEQQQNAQLDTCTLRFCTVKSRVSLQGNPEMEANLVVQAYACYCASIITVV